MEHLQYPIGRFNPQGDYSAQELQDLMGQLEKIPAAYQALTASLPEEDLEKTYRAGSWTVRQLVHHVADIHQLYYMRMKKALTEPEPVAAMIDINAWANMPDARHIPVAGSLAMIAGINQRFIPFLQGLTGPEWNIAYYHPTRHYHLSLKQTLYMAVWHASHHQAHIGLALGL
ncbi:MAG: YfiT family bacillithiol transferase [Adhaeribacter sp.]